jgi:hypothetical protein
LNIFAESKYVDSGTLTESGSTYNNADGGQYALEVSGNTAGYVGNNITLSTIADESASFFSGAYVENGGFLSLTGGSVTVANTVDFYTVTRGFSINNNSNVTLDGLCEQG